MVDKAIVSNYARLAAKYGGRVQRVQDAVDALIKADAARGIEGRVIFVDDASSLAGIPTAPVTDAQNGDEVKVCVDAISQALEPSYIVLLGSNDVIPHQELDNPLYSSGDLDRTVPSDLPYACEHGYSRDPTDFLAPTRVVGRIPDVTGATDPQYLLDLLGLFSRWQSRPRKDYETSFGITAKEWEQSSTLTCQSFLGNAAGLRISPDDGPHWNAAELAPLLHFINCHGLVEFPQFFGQDGTALPVAHDGGLIAGLVQEGTVVAAECCYGAQLYDPARAGRTMGICSTYLAGGAYAFFGSSTVSFGPADHIDNADLICMYFLRQVLAGSSTGRAVLEARQEYIRAQPVVDPTDLKTIAQFHLLGDPSVQPVMRPEVLSKAITLDLVASPVRARRRGLLSRGLAARQGASVVRPDPVRSEDRALGSRLAELSGEPGLSDSAILSYGVEEPPLIAGMKGLVVSRLLAAPEQRVHMGIVPPPPDATGVELSASTVVIVAFEEAGKIVDWKKLFAR